MKSQIKSVKQHIEIREMIRDVYITNLQNQIDVYENYLYEAYRRKDVEMKDAMIKYLTELQNRKNKHLKDKIELKHLQNSLYI